MVVIVYVTFQVSMYVIRGLNHSEVYRLKLYANSSAGLGEPAFIEILTPMILPCGSDKDPGESYMMLPKVSNFYIGGLWGTFSSFVGSN